MTNEYKQVREFMRAFGQRVPDAVTMPDYAGDAMRDTLIDEERFELSTAETIVAKFDAVIDLLYVVLGAGVDCGFSPDQIAAGFAEVHRSNMSKMWTLGEVENSKPEGHTLERPEPGKYVVRRPDGKIVKSPSYSPPNLAKILEESK